MLEALSLMPLPSAASVFSSLAIVGAVRVFEYRPRGYLNPEARLLVGRSRVPNAGRGVFAAAALPAGQILGAYPGRIRFMGEYYRKLQRVPETSTYCWQMQDGQRVLDPTDAKGQLCEPLTLVEGLALVEAGSVDTTLALINEPPPSSDVNVETHEQGDEVLFVTRRECAEGEELYLDYGQTYDRSFYGKG